MPENKFNLLKLVSLVGLVVSFIGLFLFMILEKVYVYLSIVSFYFFLGFTLFGSLLFAFDIIGDGKYKKNRNLILSVLLVLGVILILAKFS